jgi:hypothetical protein
MCPLARSQRVAVLGYPPRHPWHVRSEDVVRPPVPAEQGTLLRSVAVGAVDPRAVAPAEIVRDHIVLPARAASRPTKRPPASAGARSASGLAVPFSNGPPDDWRFCDLCKEFVREHPQTTLTAAAIKREAPAHPHPWRTGLADFDRWVAAGRPQRWPQ